MMLCAVAFFVSASSKGTTTRAWQKIEKDRFTFPEMDDPNLIAKPNTAVLFTGGGTRAMVAMLGQLQGLHQIGLLRNVRYISGMSGGAWSTHLFSFYQPGPGVARNDDEFLCGKITMPSNITLKGLRDIEPTCSRIVAAPKSSDGEQRVNESSIPFDIAIEELWQATLKKVGIPLNSYFSWNASIVENIMSRNPGQFNRSDFLLPSHPDHPFPVVGITMLGPYRLAPFTSHWRSQQYQLLEVTPLYMGVPMTSAQSYASLYPWAKGPKNLTTGGFVEPFAWGADTNSGLSPGKEHGILNLSRLPSVPFSLANATFASSYAPGETLSLAPIIDTVSSLRTDYFSPVGSQKGAPAAKETFLLADGGDYENVHLIGMVQRRVREIVVFMNSNQPLHGLSVWDPLKQPIPSSHQINDDFPYFFGVHVKPADAVEAFEQKASIDYTSNQVFKTEDFTYIALQLQEAQASGRVPIARRELETVENQHWGIEAGFVCNLTVIFLGRAGNWEQALPEDLRNLVRPEPDGEPVQDYGQEVKTGPFAHFPNYPTTAGIYPRAKANLLAEFTGWGVISERSILSEALRGDEH